MPAPKGVKVPERAPKNWNGGRRQQTTYAERYATDPQGSTPVRVPNVTLAYLERIAGEQGITVVEWLNRQEINSRIL